MERMVYELAEKYFDDYTERNGQLLVHTCPFCHGGEHHDKYTFAIGLENGAYSCLRGSCGVTGSFRKLCRELGENNLMTTETNIMKKLEAANKKKTYVKPSADDIHPVTEEILNYFALRGISNETVKAFKIGSDEHGNIVFPFYRNGVLTYVKYRMPRKMEKGERKEWQMSNTEPILFNMDNIDTKKPLYITEGQIDAMSLYEAGITNVVSVPCGCNNTDWLSLCWDWLEKFDKFVMFTDTDEPGIEMRNSVVKRLGEDRCMMPGAYPDLIVAGEYKGRTCKDANEILFVYGSETLREVAEQCEFAPIKGVLNLADVQYVAPESIERIYTRIPELDNMIGGLSAGQVVVLSGKRGQGKSTISGTWLLNALEKGYNICAYSGELPAHFFMNWIFSQATEAKYFESTIDPRSGKRYASMPKNVMDRIRNWVDNKFLLYDNSFIDNCSQEDAVLNVFTACARRYGTRMFLVDNLMSLMSGNEENETRQQARFVSKLKAFATNFNAIVLLVNIMAT